MKRKEGYIKQKDTAITKLETDLAAAKEEARHLHERVRLPKHLLLMDGGVPGGLDAIRVRQL